MFTNSPSLKSLSSMVCEEPSLTQLLNAIVDTGQTDGRMDGRTDRRFSPIHRPDLLCNPVNKRDIRNQTFNDVMSARTEMT